MKPCNYLYLNIDGGKSELANTSHAVFLSHYHHIVAPTDLKSKYFDHTKITA
jgi:hypothetical protein